MRVALLSDAHLGGPDDPNQARFLAFLERLEAEGRKWQRDAEKKAKRLALWTSPDLTKERAQAVANVDCGGPSRCYKLPEYPRQPPASQYEGPESEGSGSSVGVGLGFRVPSGCIHSTTLPASGPEDVWR